MLDILRNRILLLLTCAASAAVLAASASARERSAQPAPKAPNHARDMSPVGQRARRALRKLLGSPPATPTARAAARPISGDIGDEEEEGGGPGPLEDGGELPGGDQGELTIAIDDSGQHVVIGFNDFRAFVGRVRDTVFHLRLHVV